MEDTKLHLAQNKNRSQNKQTLYQHIERKKYSKDNGAIGNLKLTKTGKTKYGIQKYTESLD